MAPPATSASASLLLPPPGIISATSLYTSGTVRVGGNGSETCSTPADCGKNRYNSATGHMQVCKPWGLAGAAFNH